MVASRVESDDVSARYSSSSYYEYLGHLGRDKVSAHRMNTPNPNNSSLSLICASTISASAMAYFLPNAPPLFIEDEYTALFAHAGGMSCVLHGHSHQRQVERCLAWAGGS